jgi:predicted patatin/cPLA2 family phospholipase
MKTLIVEGGGMRGVYSAGVLQAFQEQGYNPYSLYIGISAGSCNISSFLAQQQHRDYRSYSWLMSSKNFISFKNVLQGKSFMNLDWLWEVNQKYNPIDVEGAFSYLSQNSKKFLAVVSNLEIGLPDYVQPTLGNWMEVLKASCAIPVFYKNKILIDGIQYVDGGLTDPLPIKKAIEMGSTEILVIRSQEFSYVKKQSFKTIIGSKFFAKHKALKELMLSHPTVYNAQVEALRTNFQNIKIHEICPKDLKMGGLTKDKSLIEYTYQQGINDGMRYLLEQKAI